MIIFLTTLLLTSSIVFISNAHSNTLSQGQSIKDGQTLLSTNKTFQLGFFRPGKSSSRYVGIWYRSSNVTIWVANREAPISDSSSRLTFSLDGNLVILNGLDSVIWTSNSSSTNSSNPTAQLTDSGNLVIFDGATPTWQSFDHPADTFVPGMKISRLTPNSRNNRILTSWKSTDDPSAGKYTLGLDTRGSAQFFIWEGGVPRWRSGWWNGVTFIGSVMPPFYLYGFEPGTDCHGDIYFTFSYFNTSLLRFVMQWDGWEKTSMKVDNGWETVWLQPLTECDIYGKCGDHGVCVYNGGAQCRCLKGFEPKSSQEWKSGNWTGGCVRRTALQCSGELSNGRNNSVAREGNRFFGVQQVKLPDLSYRVPNIESEGDCNNVCLSNCSCEAYAYPPGNIGCLIWGHELIDIYQFDDQRGTVLYLKLPLSEFGTDRKKSIIIGVVAANGVTTLIICVFFWWKRSAGRKNCWEAGKGETSSTMFLRVKGKQCFSGQREGEEGQEGTSSELPFYRFNQISAATSKFNDSNKLGQGGFGHVYKGILPRGEQIAVKRLSASSGQGLEEFKTEVILIAKLQHRNLVRLLGCCIEEEEKILVYEYMPNKSLDVFLFEPTKQELLEWSTRFSIIEGIARGLLYLHRDSRLRIIHRDLKASNILLDKDMNPKISDFGMARIFRGDQNQANTNRVVGTYGYMAPEYAMEGLFSLKSDVYSFGVLVLEIVMGKRNGSLHRILGHAWQFWSEDRAMELIDQSIKTSCSTVEVLRCIHVALLCVQDCDTERPDMATVVHMLGSETASFPTPNKPKFTLGGVPNQDSIAVVNEFESFSANDVTITVLQGR